MNTNLNQIRKGFVAGGLALAVLLLAVLLLPGCAGERYKLEDRGLLPLVESLRAEAGLPDTLTVEYFSAALTAKGYMGDYTLALAGFDEEKNFIGRYGFVWDEKEKSLAVNVPSEDLPQMAVAYNQNKDVQFLDGQAKRLPLTRQIARLDFPRYVLEFSGIKQIRAGEPILEGYGGQDFAVLAPEEYRLGLGGVADGRSGVVFTLSDGVSSAVGENRIQYDCAIADADTVTGDRDFKMEFDYYIESNYIDGNLIYFTRDFGETWISCGISPAALAETLEFYRNGVVIPEDSFSIAAGSETIALLYGERPALRISFDNGAVWEDRRFGPEVTGEDVPLWTKRFVHFFDESAGYAAFCSDWSMGTGQIRYALVTRDGGRSWTEIALPEINGGGSGNTLTGIRFADDDLMCGVVTLKSDLETEGWPHVFATVDGGASWTEIFPPWEQMPEDVLFVNKVYDVSASEDGLLLAFGFDKRRVLVGCSSLGDFLTFVSEETVAVHTVG
jgi:hypothetical protein